MGQIAETACDEHRGRDGLSGSYWRVEVSSLMVTCFLLRRPVLCGCGAGGPCKNAKTGALTCISRGAINTQTSSNKNKPSAPAAATTRLPGTGRIAFPLALEGAYRYRLAADM